MNLSRTLVGSLVAGFLVFGARDAAAWIRTAPFAACRVAYTSTTSAGLLYAKADKYYCPMISDSGFTGAPSGRYTTAIYVDSMVGAGGSVVTANAVACWSNYTGTMSGCGTSASISCDTGSPYGCDQGIPVWPKTSAGDWDYFWVQLDSMTDYYVLNGIGYSGSTP